jgi:hypothetical protein
MPRPTHLPAPFSQGSGFVLPSGFGSDSFSLLVSFDNGRVYAQPVNRRLTKADVAKLLKTTEDGVAYLAKKGCLKPLGHPDETKQKLFSASDLFAQMQDTRWLGKATDLLYQFVEEKNAAQARRNHRVGKIKNALADDDVS